MRSTWQLGLVLLSTGLPLAAQVDQQATGLKFLERDRYALIPKAKEVVTGTGVAANAQAGETSDTEKLVIPGVVNFEKDLPSAKWQGQDANSCAAFATTENKAYRIYLASGRKGSPDDYRQSPGFPYSAACRLRTGVQNGQCFLAAYITDELDFLYEIGSLPWQAMPYRPNVYEDWESRVADGKNKSIAPYTALPSAPNSLLALKVMKNLLAAENPVIMGFNACSEFRHPVNGVVQDLDRSNSECAPHAVLVVGYDTDKKLLRILNSWGIGKTWPGSIDGKVWMSEEVFLGRYMEGYVDQGPGQVVAYAGTYTQLAHSKLPANGVTPGVTGTGAAGPAPINEAPSFVITPDVLKASLRASIGRQVGHKIIRDRDDNTLHPVNRRYLWLDLPEQYANQVKSVTYHLIDPTFVPFTTTKEESSIFLVWWKGWGCVDHATVQATLIDPNLNQEKPVTADFSYCEIADDKQKPSRELD